MFLTDPSRIWYRATLLHRRGARRRARLLKGYLFLAFRAVLPPEATLAGPVALGHYGLGIVVHPNVVIGERVRLWHRVTLAVSDSPGSDTRIVIGDDCEIGTGAVVVTRLRENLSVASGVSIGANAVVTRSIEAPGSYAGIPARRI